jgi:hypothetical protein
MAYAIILLLWEGQVMNQFLDTLKARLEEAQRRVQIATQRLQAAQVEHQSASQAFSSWTIAYQEEMRKEQGIQAVPPAIPSPAVPVRSSPAPTDRLEVNKTEIVRNILREHPAGMSASELWRSVNTQIAHRPYLYSILKRLNDKGDIYKKRGKYFPKLSGKNEDTKEAHSMVQ